MGIFQEEPIRKSHKAGNVRFSRNCIAVPAYGPLKPGTLKSILYATA